MPRPKKEVATPANNDDFNFDVAFIAMIPTETKRKKFMTICSKLDTSPLGLVMALVEAVIDGRIKFEKHTKTYYDIQ